jgi:IclR family KDG regulon transcriptional repressor
MNEPDKKSYYFLNTVGRAVAVLEQFTKSDAELGVAEISRRLKLHKSVTHRILATLTDLKLLAPGSVEGTYRLGVKTLELGLSYLRHSPIDRVAERHLIRLAQQLPDMAFHVAIFDGTEIVYQKSIAGTQAKWPAATLGRRQQAYCTSLGKVLLAYLSPAEIEMYLSKVELRPLTPNTITSPSALREELEQVRLREWAFDNQEAYPGNCCVGVPIREHTGKVIAALSLAGLAQHFQQYGRDNLRQLAQEAAAAISYDLGFSTYSSETLAVNDTRQLAISK